MTERSGLRLWIIVVVVVVVGAVIFVATRRRDREQTTEEVALPAVEAPAIEPAPEPPEAASEVAGATLEFYSEEGETPILPDAEIINWTSDEQARATGTLTVRSVPTGAQVFIDGQFIHQSPCRIQNLSALRSLQVELRLEGYAPYSRRIQIPPDRETGLGVRMPRLRLGLTVVTIPAGADIFVDGEAKGKSPVTIPEMADDSEHTVRTELAGYAPSTQVIRTPAQESTLLSLRLEKIVGDAAIFTEEEGVEILVNGQPLGATMMQDGGFAFAAIDMLEPGVHEIELRKPGFLSKQYVVNVEKGRTINLNMKLDPVFSASYEVETVDGSIYRGRLARILYNGTIRLEIAPSQYRNFPPSIVKAHGEL